MNSRFFQATPLKNLTLARLLLIQTVKRSPVNLRPLLKILPGVNAKGVALFALAEIARYRATKNQGNAQNARHLLAKLLELKFTAHRSPLTAQTSFGYNFDWQSRAFFAPQGTPTIVPTAFAARALVEAFELFGDQIYWQTAVEICNFIETDLNQSASGADEICFSYTPLDHSIIFNASLLAGETLASVGARENNEGWLALATKSARFVLRRQTPRGAWEYGTKLRHRWVDNFHTAFILASLWRMKRALPNLSDEIETAVQRGYAFWTQNLFLPDGAPKYYDTKIFPIDIHSAAAAIAALCDLREWDKNAVSLAEMIGDWTIRHLRDEAGFFYYQKHRIYTVKTPFIRWAQAWMAFAIARLIESQTTNASDRTSAENRNS